MNPVFLDTVGLLAIWDSDDQWHSAASGVFAELLSTRRRLLTTTFVLLECGNASARRPYRSAVDDLRKILDRKEALISPLRNDEIEGWDAYRRGDAAQAGIVDQVSFVVMRRLGITQAFTNDQHFEAAGFEVLF